MAENPGRSERIRAIFDEVVDLSPTERAAALGRHCPNDHAADASIRAEVEALLASHDAAGAGGFMTSPTADTTVRAALITEGPGTRVGPYKLLQVIGEGGFGTVFLAEQTEPVRRRVALKIIKLGMDTKQVIARFEAERQALALMDHPHIARVLDAGATPVTEHGGGRPYFVMEYVVGDVITHFADAHGLKIKERLELFAQVCSAVQHAHTKGIIHRDIKPGNVLVTMTDGKPFARVIDFGIAKATSSVGGLTEKTLFTEHRQLIGTPEYMSPEQAQGSPDIDTRTDVYALGVLLYELLAGETPFDAKRLRSAAWDEMRRIIKEEEPPTPSARVTQRLGRSALRADGSAGLGRSALRADGSDALGRSAPRPDGSDALRTDPHLATTDSPAGGIALTGGESRKPQSHESARRADLPKAPSFSPVLLRGELDWIVMKSLDKERGRRYETPSALAADVLRHLRGEAVQAAPPSAAYRLKKFVRRHKVRSGFAAVIGLGVAGTLVGLGIAQYNARAAIHNGKIAQAAREELEAANTQLRGQFDRVQEGVGRMMTLLSDGAVGAPIVPKAASGQMMDAADPVEYAVGWGIMLAEQLKEDRDSLAAQTDAAEWSAYTANLALAQAAMDAGNWPEARERLRQCPESKRGWEWEFALRRAGSTEVFVPGDFSNAWLRDQYVVVQERATGRVRTFSRETGKETESIETRTKGLAPLVGWDATPPRIEPGSPFEKLLTQMPSYRYYGYLYWTDESEHGYLVGTSHDNEVLVVNASTGIILTRITVDGQWLASAALSPDGTTIVGWVNIGEGGGSNFGVYVWPLPAAGGPIEFIAPDVLQSLRVDAVPRTQPQDRTLQTVITTPDRARRIVVGGDRFIRFTEVESAREVASFALPQPAVSIDMTDDGTRLIIHLSDGSARIWDIRDPSERVKDAETKWAERVPAAAYLDTLLASPMATDALMDEVVNDASLTPLRRLVAAEMLQERLGEIDRAAESTFERIMRDAEKATDAWQMIDTKAIKAHVTAAAAALEPSDDLPTRAIEKVIAQAEAWEYRPSESSPQE